jgi:hypothetical protein
MLWMMVGDTDFQFSSSSCLLLIGAYGSIGY